MNCLVTTVITTYKGLDTIKRAVESVLSQTYRNIETIVVDDNGLGSEAQIATENIIKQYPEVIYIPHKINKNGSAARNTGLKRAKGKYICFLDDDDFYYPERIEKVVSYFEKLDDSYGVVHNSSKQIFPNGKSYDLVAKAEGNQFFNFIATKFRMGTSNVTFRKKVLEEVNGFDESFQRHQDWELLCRVLYKYKLGAIDYIGTGRVVVNRNAPTNAEKIEEQRLYYLEKMKPYIQILTLRQQREVYAPHYCFIAKEYFCSGNYHKYWEYAIKSGNILKALFMSLRSRVYRRIKQQ